MISLNAAERGFFSSSFDSTRNSPTHVVQLPSPLAVQGKSLVGRVTAQPLSKCNPEDLKKCITEQPFSDVYDAALLQLYDIKGRVQDLIEFFIPRFRVLQSPQFLSVQHAFSLPNCFRLLALYAPEVSLRDYIPFAEGVGVLVKDEKTSKLAIARKAYQEGEFGCFWEQIHALLRSKNEPLSSILSSLEGLAAEIKDPFFLERCAHYLGEEKVLSCGSSLCSTTLEARLCLYNELEFLHQNSGSLTERQVNGLCQRYEELMGRSPEMLGTVTQFIHFLLRHDRFEHALSLVLSQQEKIGLEFMMGNDSEAIRMQLTLFYCLELECLLDKQGVTEDILKRMDELSCVAPFLHWEKAHLLLALDRRDEALQVVQNLPSSAEDLTLSLLFWGCLDLSSQAPVNPSHYEKIECYFHSLTGFAEQIRKKHVNRSRFEQIHEMLDNLVSSYIRWPLCLQHKAWLSDPSIRISTILAMPSYKFLPYKDCMDHLHTIRLRKEWLFDDRKTS